MKILINSNNVVLAWQSVGGGWSDTENTTIEVESIPEEVKATPQGYKYVDGEYTANLDYVPAEQSEPLTIEDLALAIEELAEVIANG